MMAMRVTVSILVVSRWDSRHQVARLFLSDSEALVTLS